MKTFTLQYFVIVSVAVTSSLKIIVAQEEETTASIFGDLDFGKCCMRVVLFNDNVDQPVSL